MCSSEFPSSSPRAGPGLQGGIASRTLTPPTCFMQRVCIARREATIVSSPSKTALSSDGDAVAGAVVNAAIVQPAVTRRDVWAHTLSKRPWPNARTPLLQSLGRDRIGGSPSVGGSTNQPTSALRTIHEIAGALEGLKRRPLRADRLSIPGASRNGKQDTCAGLDYIPASYRQHQLPRIGNRARPILPSSQQPPDSTDESKRRSDIPDRGMDEAV
jgi:hypothetical protein